MAQEKDHQNLLDRIAGLRDTLVGRSAGDIGTTPHLADELVRRIDEIYEDVVRSDRDETPPPDLGVAELAGIGAGAARKLGDTRLPHGVEPYDETVQSERINAVGDLYYIYQHEKIGVFRVIKKLKELFNAGAVRLSSGDGAFRLYQFDRRDVLRYTLRDRIFAYRRALGYGSATLPAESRPNLDFHGLFGHFINQIAIFWRDKRISDVVRERAYDPSFGSIAIVRRAGLDLRNNLKFTSFGHINVMRVEVMQLLDEAFRILEADDVKNLFGVDNAWDVVDEVLVRYFNEQIVSSPRQRMAETGRKVLHWLGQPHIMKSQRVPFESLLLEIAEPAEEWLTSAQSLGVARRAEGNRVLPWDQSGAPPSRSAGRRPQTNGQAANGSTNGRAANGAQRGRRSKRPAMS